MRSAMLFRYPISVSLAFAATAIASPLDQQHPILEDEHGSFNGEQVDLNKEFVHRSTIVHEG